MFVRIAMPMIDRYHCSCVADFQSDAGMRQSNTKENTLINPGAETREVTKYICNVSILRII